MADPFQQFSKDFSEHCKADPIALFDRFKVRPHHVRQFKEGFTFIPDYRTFAPRIIIYPGDNKASYFDY
jgi:hypothetical protein